MLKLHHSSNGNNWARYFDDYDNNPTDAFALKNTASKIKAGGSTTNYTFDDCGNMLTEGSSRHFEWSYGELLRSYRTQAGTSEPTVYTHYLYDAGGVRVKKISRHNGADPTVSVYIDGTFEHLYQVNISTDIRSYEHNEIHVMDDRIRIAQIRTGTPFSSDSSPAVRYFLEDHLGNSSFTLYDTGTLFSREEYFPFGETSFGSFAKKRYRFCGKERDEESGLYYYGARYYAAWTCRFVSVDPLAGDYPFYTPYQYAGNQPVNSIDIDGLETNPATSTSPQGEGSGNSHHSGTPLKNGYNVSNGSVNRKFEYSGIISGTPKNYVEQSPDIGFQKNIAFEHAAPMFKKAFDEVESKYKNKSIEEKAKEFNAIIAKYTLATQDGQYGQSNCNANSKLIALYGYEIIDPPKNNRGEIETSQNFLMDKFGLTKDQLHSRSSGNKVSNCFTDCNWSTNRPSNTLKHNKIEYDKLQREAINLLKKIFCGGRIHLCAN